MGEDEIEKYIRLSLMPGFGVLSQNKLLRICGGLDSCFRFPLEELMHIDESNDKHMRVGSRKLESFVGLIDSQELIESTKGVLETCENKGIEIITAGSPQYPCRFMNLPDMPIVLYVKGNLRINDHACSVGIVGARRCSAEGKEKAIEITENEIKSGCAIISGMAKGIDSYAHTAAIKNSGYTIAVLGNGPDICYPKEHQMLYDEITEHGCIVSEYPPGTQPRNYMFPKRNRLIAALSDIVYVVDTGRHSGTDTTVDACISYCREVRRIGLKYC